LSAEFSEEVTRSCQLKSVK